MLAEANVTTEEIELRTDSELLESILSPQNVDVKIKIKVLKEGACRQQ